MTRKKTAYYIYYQKKESALYFDVREHISPSYISKTHAPIGIIRAYGLEHVFYLMNIEHWIFSKGIKKLTANLVNHSSMSINDVIYDETDERWYQVMPVGFKEITE
jgi:hypothetical protein